MVKKIIPYLQFDGECEEALHFYKKILGGEVKIVERYDNPNMNAPVSYRNKVLHARFIVGDAEIFASDIFPGRPLERSSGDIALSMDVNSEEDGKRIFTMLSDGGQVIVPFEKQFWGEWHGNFTDKYGIRWMINK